MLFCVICLCFFFFKQKTAYEMRISDWSSDVCSSDLRHGDVIAVDSHNSYAYARRLVALVGVDDLVVVETDDAVLVARKDKVQQVKDVVAKIGRASCRERVCQYV